VLTQFNFEKNKNVQQADIPEKFILNPMYNLHHTFLSEVSFHVSDSSA